MDREEKIELLLTKGVAELLPNKGFIESALRSGKVLTVYAGFDPTAPTLHIGHGVQLRKLRHFQDLGHKIIFLIGDFTARIGDPTDKGAARTRLTEREIKHNLKLYKQQAGKFIRFTGKNAATVKFNNKWLGKMKFADVLELASHMTVDQMLKRDMFQRRIEEDKPIYIHEFMYPLMQGYDSVAMNVDGEVGGNDQLFNIMAGRTLLKAIKNKEKFIVTTKLLEDNNGKKMGKSEGNMVSLLDTPADMYGKVMSWTDSLIVQGFELCTDYTPAQVAYVQEELSKGINPRDLKMRLAFEIVKSCSDEKEATKAEAAFVATFQDRTSNDSIQEIKHNNRSLEIVLVEEGIIASKSELRRLLAANAVTDFETKEKISEDTAKTVVKGTYKIGKNRFIKII